MVTSKRSMKTYRPGQKRSRLFARLNPNFASGRYAPPSKNRAQQSRLFRSNNPYAKDSQVMRGIQPVGGQTQGPASLPSGYGQQPVSIMDGTGMTGNRWTGPTGGVPGPRLPYQEPTRTAQPVGQGVPLATIGDPVSQPPTPAFGQGSTIADLMRAQYGGGSVIGDPVSQGPGPGLNPEAQAAYSKFGQGSQISDIMRAQFGGAADPARTAQPVGGGVMGPGMNVNATASGAGLPGVESQLNPDAQIRDASQALAQGLGDAGGMITPEALERMRRGYPPTYQDVNPAFHRYASPFLRQTLAGLWGSVGQRPEEQQFYTQQFTPAGLR